VSKFTFFVAEYLNDASKDSSKGNKFNIDPENISKRIIIITQEFLIAISYEEELVENLKLMQKGLDAEKLIQVLAEDMMRAGSTSSNWQINKRPLDGSGPDRMSLSNGNLKTQNPRMQISTSPMTTSMTTFNNGITSDNVKENIIIKSLFPLKLLLRITSKKYNPNYLSFYFKLPNLEKNFLLEYYKFVNLLNGSVLESFIKFVKEAEYVKLIKKICEVKDANAIMQSKGVYIMESEKVAKDCINKTKDAYNALAMNMAGKIVTLKK